ncbi:hypothetical protein PV08_02647 [Exophiala spinifera]|uniref:Transcription factor domain-containing protein n=1 Tax=Exophiala spinifera TaxID=91928 RepID=A0A0D2C3Z9_9EURO|nr:uncharacterized protein PV08_02647 [Exophiala spinifera]KIW18359.1 hypothetical protein PV08_02647 [Exophiala spinifera]
MDLTAAGEEPPKGSNPPDLLMDAEIQQQMDDWRISGEPPLRELRMQDRLYWTRFTTFDLRLIHHIVIESTKMHLRGYSNCTVWGPKIHSLISAAMQHDFAMSALLALSASDLAWQTKNSDTYNLAYHHRGVALKGLHEAIGDFSRENSEAILAASILLSWQATEWRAWASLQQGAATVMSAMRPWIHESEFARYLQDQRAMARAGSPATPTLPNAQLAVSSDDLRKVEHIITALQTLKLRLSNSQELVEHATHLVEYLQQLQQDMQPRNAEQTFAKLQLLRDWIFWLPPRILRRGESDLAPLVLLAHVYASALAVESVLPELGGAYLGGMSVHPLDNVRAILEKRRKQQPQDTGIQVALSLIEAPVQVLVSYRLQQHHNTNQGGQSMESYRYSPSGSPYAAPSISMSSTTSDLSTAFPQSPPGGPGILSPPASSYFQAALGPVETRRDSSAPILGRAHSMGERPLGSSGPHTMGMVYGTPPQYARSSHEVPGSRMDYFGQSQAPYNQYGSMNMNTRFVTPSQLWA